MNELALFAGAGGGILGGRLLGWHTVAACELERYPREVLLARQRDGMLDKFPIWDDVCTFDGRPWRGLVDVVSGGFPCQDISSAGKGAGIEGARSGLWKEMFRIVCEVRPRFAFMENSPMLTSRGLGVVLGDLAEAGYNAEWMVLGAADVGAPHQRDRIWILAYDAERGELFPHADLHGAGWGEQLAQGAAQKAGLLPDPMQRRGRRVGCCKEVENALDTDAERKVQVFIPNANMLPSAEQHESHERTEELAGGGTHGVEAGGYVPHADKPQRQGVDGVPEQCEPQDSGTGDAGGIWCAGDGWAVEPDVGRVADGVAARVDRLKAIGNGQVPLVAATAFTILMNRIYDYEQQRHGA